MDGRRYLTVSTKLIEAKENVEIEDESKTMATITLPKLLRMYEKLSDDRDGYIEEEEFAKSMHERSRDSNQPSSTTGDAVTNSPKSLNLNSRWWLTLRNATHGQPILAGIGCR